MDQNNIQYYELMPVEDHFYEDVINGLTQTSPAIPPKYFYDQEGSQLFDQIAQTQDYYPTRTELSILHANAKEISERIGEGKLLIEPGGANFEKVSLLLRELQPSAYVPMDISAKHMERAVKKLAHQYSSLMIYALTTDFTKRVSLPTELEGRQCVTFFPGSSIGNFSPEQAEIFLATIGQMMGHNGYLLIGVDLKKDIELLNRAYNDSEGLTAEFNLNLLSRMNRELGADFDKRNWQHRAFYNKDSSRIEMHLESVCQQVVNINEHQFSFNIGESIHTENSYKYSIKDFQRLANRAGYNAEAVWTDVNQLFSVHLFSFNRQ